MTRTQRLIVIGDSAVLAYLVGYLSSAGPKIVQILVQLILQKRSVPEANFKVRPDVGHSLGHAYWGIDGAFQFDRFFVIQFRIQAEEDIDHGQESPGYIDQ